MKWAINGGIVAVVGLILIVAANRPPRKIVSSVGA
jgi:hypothetical protein